MVSLDLSDQMLRRARARSGQSPCVVADGHRMPVRDATVDVATFAQSWHWFDQGLATAEVARILKPGGYWAAWWNRASAPGETWFEKYEDLLSTACPGYTWRRRRDTEMEPDWSGELAGTQGVVEPAVRESVLGQLAGIVWAEFPEGRLAVRHETTLILARKT